MCVCGNLAFDQILLMVNKYKYPKLLDFVQL